MKLKVALLFGLSCSIIISSAKPADEFESENAAVPITPPKQSARSNLLNKRILSRGGSVKTTTTTTTTPPPEVEPDEEYVDEEAPEEQLPVETTSTTEQPRRLKGGVRPFRSNQELLKILQKRRDQALLNKTKHKAVQQEPQEPAPPAPEPEKSQKRTTSNSRGRFSKKEVAAPVEEEEPLPSPVSSRTNSARRFRN